MESFKAPDRFCQEGSKNFIRRCGSTAQMEPVVARLEGALKSNYLCTVTAALEPALNELDAAFQALDPAATFSEKALKEMKLESRLPTSLCEACQSIAVRLGRWS